MPYVLAEDRVGDSELAKEARALLHVEEEDGAIEERPTTQDTADRAFHPTAKKTALILAAAMALTLGAVALRRSRSSAPSVGNSDNVQSLYGGQTVDWYDCDAAFNNWRREWSEEKKVWCCDHQSRGCGLRRHPVAHMAARAAVHAAHYAARVHAAHYAVHQTFDCAAGFSNWRAGWAPDKKDYCCRHEGVGCEHAQTQPSQFEQQGGEFESYDCSAAFRNWRTAWSSAKKRWCCRHEGLGCEAQPRPAQSLTFDCTEGYSHWRTGWSDEKKDWCCAHEGAACGYFDLEGWWWSHSEEQRTVLTMLLWLLPVLCCCCCCAVINHRRQRKREEQEKLLQKQREEENRRGCAPWND